jgi:hypothetical protein
MSPFVGRSLLAARRPLALLAAVAALALGCGRSEPAPTPAGTVATATTPPSRAAYIASVQGQAGPRYHAQAVGPGAWRARSTGLTAQFAVDGVRVETKSSAWHLRLARFGCGGDLRPVAPATPVASGNRVEYDRTQPGHDLKEWYLSGPLGLEQGFTIAQAPACAGHAGHLRLELDSATHLTPSFNAARDALELRAATGAVALRYGDLHVTDATGRELPARMELADGTLALAVDAAGAAYPVTIDPLVAIEQQKLLVSGSHSLAGAVAVSGDTAVLNETGDKVHVFTRSGSTWSKQQTIPAPSSYDDFGRRIAVDADTLVMSGAHQPTRAYVAWAYARTSGTWALQGTLDPGVTAPTTPDGAVAISGETALVAAVGTGSKSAVFVRASGTWSHQQDLTDFGPAAALDGDTAIIGRAGARQAYVWVRAGTSWSQQQVLTPTGGATGDGFGAAVAVRGDLAVVGAPDNQNGAAYVFARSGTTWSQVKKLLASDGASGDEYGVGVAAYGDMIVIGARSHKHDLVAGRTGAAYSYTGGGSAWTAGPELLASDGEAADMFGDAVALAGRTVVVGAYSVQQGFNEVGAAYAFVIVYQDGDACAHDYECLHGHCKDGVCCDVACDQPCWRCDLSATKGTCTQLTGGEVDDPECPGPKQCGPTGHCGRANGFGPCASGADCASEHCVDAVCCATACTASCDACAASLKASGAGDGTCGVAKAAYAGDPGCGLYLCDGVGVVCPTTCAGDGDCAATAYCDRDGHCQTQVAQGGVCNDQAGADCFATGCRVCATGHCVDGRCCENACTAPCLSCGNAAGTCTSFVGKGSEDTGCTGTQACDGAGTCKKKDGQACGGAGECVSGKCVDSTCCVDDCTTPCRSCATAAGTCTGYVGKGSEDNGCTGTQACDGAGGCKKKDGQFCTDPTDCVSGNCVDTVCCDTPCTAACYACRADLKATGADSGQCGLAAAGVDPRGNCAAEAHNTCGQDGECNGSGGCRKWGYGTSCDAATYCDGNTVRGRICNGDGLCIDNTSGVDCGRHVCRSGGCINPCGGDGDCVAGNWCNAGVCVAKQAEGTVCAEGRQCTSSFCVDGVCCDTLCNGLCQACAAALKASGADNGVCGNAAAGLDPHDQCPDDGPASCDRNGTCDGAGQCAIYPAAFTCKPPSCDADARVTWACDGSGTCQGTPNDCGAFACAAGVCASTCSGDDDCDADAFCDGSTCTAKWTNGTPCTEGRTCAKGWCIDGVCCATACTGQCEACDVEGLAGTCAPVNGDPHGDRDPCPGATGGDPCTGRACRGGTDPTQCVGWAGIDVPCREASCVDGLETRSATCDGGGHCSNPDTKECQPYVCRGDACGAEPCGGDTDCVAEFRCDPATHKCVPRDMATCDGDHTVTAPDGTTQTDCSPYVCEVGENGGVCKDSCTATTDCVAGYVCDTLQGQGVCVAAGGGGGGNQGGGCAAAGATRGGGLLGLMLLLLLGTLRRGTPAGRARRRQAAVAERPPGDRRRAACTGG